MVKSGAWGKLIYEKTRSKKSCDTVPLELLQQYLLGKYSNGFSGRVVFLGH
jgi:hypothetical protein